MVWDWPDASVQLTEIESPGWYLTRVCATFWAEVTDWPPIAVIVSPWVRPALAAGEPETVWATVAPLVAPWLPWPPNPPNPP